MALLRCNGSPIALIASFRSVGSGVSHLHLDKTPSILFGVQVRRACWPIKHLWQCGQVPNPAGK